MIDSATREAMSAQRRLGVALSCALGLGLCLSLIMSCAEESKLSADARRVTTREDLVGGPSALGELKDFVLENDRIKVIIQDKGYSRGFGVYGGGLIDADRKRPVAPGNSDVVEGRDSFGELFPIYFLQALNPQSVEAFPPSDQDPDARVVVKGDGGEFLSITKVLNRALVNSYTGTDGFDNLGDLISALGEGLDSLITDTPRIGFELVYRLSPNADHVVIESTMENKEDSELRIPSDIARVLFSLPNFSGIARDPFRVPLGFVALFGAGNQVFAPGFGFDIRFNLEDRYALSSLANEEKSSAQDSGAPLTAAQDRTLALPELPGLITPGLISVSPEGNSYGIFALPERVERSAEELAAGASLYPKSFAYNRLEPLKPDEEDSPSEARNVYSKLFEDEVDPGDALIPFSASSFTGMFSAQAPELLGPKERYTVRHAFIVGVGDVSSVMDSYYKLRDVKVAPVEGEVLDQVDGSPVAGASVIFYDERSRPISQSFSDGSGRFKLTLPPATYRARVQDGPTLGPMSEFVLKAEGAALRLTRLTPARVIVDVKGEDSAPLPAKVSVVGYVDPSKAGIPLKDHLFELASGEAWRTDDLVPDDPQNIEDTMRYIEGSAVTHEGVATLDVPPGTYEIYISRGTEYELKKIKTTLQPGQVFSHAELLKRELYTEGYISADFHLHAAPSLDSDLPLRRRVRTAAAEGLEHLVATDHNFVTDYQPFIEREGLNRWLSSMIGLELTTLEAGHFNTFPIKRDKSQITRGSFEWSDRPPQAIFDTAREGGEAPIIQVNHPRDQLLGYFSQYTFDALRAEVPPPPEGPGNPLDALGQLIDPSGPAFFDEEGQNQYSGDFDVIEVLNHGLFHEEFHGRMPELDPNRVYGAQGGLSREELSEIPTDAILCDGEEVAYPGVIDDWFNLLNLGERYAGTANSDSHHGDDIGYPRTYVNVGEDDPSKIRADEVAAGVRAKAMTLSRGPFLELFVNGAPIGSELVSMGGEVEVLVRVQAASWVDVQEGTLYVNGAPLRRFEVNLGAERSFEWRESLTLPKDSWLIAQVKGERSMFPVAPPIDLPPMLLNEAFGAIAGPLGLGGGELDEVAPPMTGVFKPFAITNPIWVDIDGAGFEAPGLINRACNGRYVEELEASGEEKRLDSSSPLPHPERSQRPGLQRRSERERLKLNRAKLRRSFGFPRSKGDIRDVRVMFEHFASHGHGGG